MKTNKIKEAKEKEVKTYEVHTTEGVIKKITIPASWKVTLGPLVPGARRDRYGQNRPFPVVLRIYETKEQQRAMFPDVVSFRDLDIIVIEEETKGFGPRVEGAEVERR